MNRYHMGPGSLAAIAAAALVLAPGTAFGQRGASSSPAAPAETAEQAQPAPQAMQCGQMRGQMRGQGMQTGAPMTERERLEQMREHMISGMRRMAVRMTAVQNRILALDRGEPNSAPPVEMGPMGQGMQMRGQDMRMQGQGMRMRDGAGAGCNRMQPAEDEAGKNSTGTDR